MAKRVLVPLIVMLVLGAFPAAGWSQAAAEYGMAAGAAAATGKAASAVNQATQQVGDRLQQATPNAQTAPNTQATPGTQTTPNQQTTTTPPVTPNPPAPFATKPLEAVMKENKEKLEAKAQQGGATLSIDSLPPKATVFVDGTVVGYTPAELKLAAGQHLIELKQADSMPWRKDVSLSAGETLTLKPVLPYKYQSVITLR